jgi:hypothetical protein
VFGLFGVVGGALQLQGSEARRAELTEALQAMEKRTANLQSGFGPGYVPSTRYYQRRSEAHHIELARALQAKEKRSKLAVATLAAVTVVQHCTMVAQGCSS